MPFPPDNYPYEDTDPFVSEYVNDIVAAIESHLAATASVHGINDTSDLVSTSTLTELVQDIVGAMFADGTHTGATVTYEDVDGSIDLEVTSIGATGPQGPPGATGPSGPPGIGVQGLQGHTGPAGGATGATGPSIDTGVDLSGGYSGVLNTATPPTTLDQALAIIDDFDFTDANISLSGGYSGTLNAATPPSTLDEALTIIDDLTDANLSVSGSYSGVLNTATPPVTLDEVLSVFDDLTDADIPVSGGYSGNLNTATPPTALDEALAVIDDLNLDPGYISENEYTDDHRVDSSDIGKVINMNKSSAVNLTLPGNGDIPVGIVIHVYNSNTGDITLVGGESANVRNNVAISQYEQVSVRRRATDEWIVF